ncbi:MAG TPA: flavodoxin [Bacteroidales bacterium]|nr:flavodoxin [Bacteroidales bacterium]
MEKIALIYSYNTRNTANVAKEIVKAFGKSVVVEELNAEDIDGQKFSSYNNLILGVPTWFDGELPNYWDEFVPELETLDLKGKRIAIFGLGDQVNYPENFVDGIGLMVNICKKAGAEIVGYTDASGYTFESSAAFSGGKFCGLAIDIENQGDLNDERIESWVSQLKKEFR